MAEAGENTPLIPETRDGPAAGGSGSLLQHGIASAPNLALILSPGGHQYHNYAATATRAPGTRRGRNANGVPTRLAGAGGNLPSSALMVGTGSINNSENGDGPDHGDPLRGFRAHIAPAVASSRDRLSTSDRIAYYNRIKAEANRQAEAHRREDLERRRQETLDEGEEWNSEDEERLYVPGPNDHFLAIPDAVARREFAGFTDHMSNIYQVSLFKSGADDDRVHSFVTVLNIWNTMMGTSVLAMPWAFAEAGLAAAILLCLINGPVAAFTAILVDRLHKKASISANVAEFVHVCKYYVGSGLKFLVNIGSFGAVTGAAIVYLILISNFQLSIGNYFYYSNRNDSQHNITNTSLICVNPSDKLLDEEEADNSIFKTIFRQKPLLLINAIMFLALFTFVNPTRFRKLNAVGSLCNLGLIGIVMYFAFTWGINAEFSNPDATLYMPMFRPKAYRLTGILSMGLFLHNAVITIVSKTRHQENNTRDIALGYSLVTVTYVILGLAFYLTFPLAKRCIADNFINNFPNSNIMMIVVRCFLLIQLSTIYPIIGMIWRDAARHVFSLGSPDGSWIKKVIYNILLLAICVIVAIVLPSIGVVITVFGSICGFLLIYYAPSHVAWNVMRREGNFGPKFYAISLLFVAITLFGACNLSFNLYDFTMRFETSSDNSKST